MRVVPAHVHREKIDAACRRRGGQARLQREANVALNTLKAVRRGRAANSTTLVALLLAADRMLAANDSGRAPANDQLPQAG